MIVIIKMMSPNCDKIIQPVKDRNKKYLFTGEEMKPNNPELRGIMLSRPM